MNMKDITFLSAEGKSLRLNDFNDKVILIVNTATKCGLAPQLSELESLHQKYGADGLMIIGFPSDQFKQEPESDGASAAKVCAINYGVSFQMTDKVLLNGSAAHPLFVELKKALPGGIFGSRIKWNFTKFLLAPGVVPYKRFAPTKTPLSFEQDIVKLLKQK